MKKTKATRGQVGVEKTVKLTTQQKNIRLKEITEDEEKQRLTSYIKKRKEEYKNTDYIDALMLDALMRSEDNVLQPELDTAVKHWQGVKNRNPKPST